MTTPAAQPSDVPTPRTDAVATDVSFNGGTVMADFARELEIELTIMTNDRNGLMAINKQHRNDLAAEKQKCAALEQNVAVLCDQQRRDGEQALRLTEEIARCRDDSAAADIINDAGESLYCAKPIRRSGSALSE